MRGVPQLEFGVTDELRVSERPLGAEAQVLARMSPSRFMVIWQSCTVVGCTALVDSDALAGTAANTLAEIATTRAESPISTDLVGNRNPRARCHPPVFIALLL
jgi:hypothetical protein